MLLLDTHVWIWSVQGDTRRIGSRTRRLLATAEARDVLRVSPVSLFEVAALHTLGRLRLTRSPEQWMRESLDAGTVRIADLSPAIAVAAGQIARDALPDPLDRLLVATASYLEATLLTSDARILEYGSSTGAVRTHHAGG